VKLTLIPSLLRKHEGLCPRECPRDILHCSSCRMALSALELNLLERWLNIIKAVTSDLSHAMFLLSPTT